MEKDRKNRGADVDPTPVSTGLRVGFLKEEGGGRRREKREGKTRYGSAEKLRKRMIIYHAQKPWTQESKRGAYKMPEYFPPEFASKFFDSDPFLFHIQMAQDLPEPRGYSCS